MNYKEFKDGIKDGVPIALGYLAVSFSLGIAAKKVGVTIIQGGISSFFTYASAGQYAIFALIGSCGSMIETIIMTLVVNMRYLLMGCAIAQKIDVNEKFIHRIGIGACCTDEIFGISIARNKLHHNYPYGAWLIAVSFWAIGTMLGIAVGNILPDDIVKALGVAIFGMFIAIVIPAGKKDKYVMLAIITSFLLSYLLNNLSIFNFMSSNTIIIILTILISAIFAYFFPKKEDKTNE